MPLYVYYHICLINNWKSIVREQCTRIVFSGLYDKLERIKCYAIDPTEKKSKKCSKLLKSYGTKFVLEDSTKCGNEWFTLRHMQETANDDDRVLYLHTKGVTRKRSNIYTTIQNNMEFKFKIANLYDHITEWRDLMEYFLICRHAECLKTLDQGEFDSIGVNLCTSVCGPNHYSGNFWWAHGKHLKKLSYDNEVENDVESWLQRIPGKFVSFYQSPYIGYGHYFYKFPLTNVVDRTVPSSNDFFCPDLKFQGLKGVQRLS